MSDTGSSRTKSVTETSDSESIGNPLIADRWSNNISYQHLVVSSCIGIVQIWWHPYIHDLRKLLPFLFLYNVFSICVGFPMFYLELALGVVTKKGVLNCWDLAPMARGIGYAMLPICVFTALAAGAAAAWSLALLVHSLHVFLPGLHCAAAARPACAARHRPLPPAADTPAQSFFYNFVLNLKRDGLEGGMGTLVWELAVYFVICWFLIYCIAVKRIYSYSKLVLFKDILTFFVLLCCGLGAARLEGAGTMFQHADWSVLLDDFQIWRDAIDYALIQMTVSQGSLVMLGTYCPGQRHGLARTALLALAASKASSMAAALLLGAAHGALQHDYRSVTSIANGSSSSMILWADYAARLPGSQFWSALIFFTLLVLALTSAALLVQTVMSTFTGRSIRKITWAFLVLNCILLCLIGAITLCTQGGMYILNFVMRWGSLKPRAAVAAAAAAAVTYVYGQTTFCEDIYYAAGEYPCVFLRVCWALSPALLMAMFVANIGELSTAESVAGWTLAVFQLLPILVVTLLYLVFKCRVRNIVATEK